MVGMATADLVLPKLSKLPAIDLQKPLRVASPSSGFYSLNRFIMPHLQASTPSADLACPLSRLLLPQQTWHTPDLYTQQNFSEIKYRTSRHNF
ncbi:hypothetical protein AVEN_155687-1 [Araneus ventricosus]|uniref:Uncharacterized protein n=1 Tax=Araneus ventricosus TaxID=182803 RepID=A0A4Y2SSK8_ARAVE|nr:hypothetical protein AVEN_155687-1 [Araneus ventricosus]